MLLVKFINTSPYQVERGVVFIKTDVFAVIAPGLEVDGIGGAGLALRTGGGHTTIGYLGPIQKIECQVTDIQHSCLAGCP